MEDVESSKPEARKLQKSVSYDLSEDEDYNSVADSDTEENSNGLKRSVGYVSITMQDDIDVNIMQSLHSSIIYSLLSYAAFL